MEQTTIFLAEGQQYVRDAMRLMLDNQPDFTVIGEINNGDTLLNEIDGLHPNVLLLDWFLPALDPIQTLRGLRQQTPQSLIIVTSVRPELKIHVQQFDIDGFLSKQLSPDQFIGRLKELIEKKQEREI